MKAIIFSDSHGNFNAMLSALKKEGKVDLIIHAGDVQRDVEDLEIMYQRTVIAAVKGNNDFWNNSVPQDRFFTFDNVKIFLTHGHAYGVKYSLAKLIQKSKELDADLCIFGHTHIPHEEISGRLRLFNPGSAARHYGVLETSGENFTLTLKNI